MAQYITMGNKLFSVDMRLVTEYELSNLWERAQLWCRMQVPTDTGDTGDATDAADATARVVEQWMQKRQRVEYRLLFKH